MHYPQTHFSSILEGYFYNYVIKCLKKRINFMEKNFINYNTKMHLIRKIKKLKNWNYQPTLSKFFSINQILISMRKFIKKILWILLNFPPYFSKSMIQKQNFCPLSFLPKILNLSKCPVLYLLKLLHSILWMNFFKNTPIPKSILKNLQLFVIV